MLQRLGIFIGLLIIGFALALLVAFALDTGRQGSDPLPGHAVGLAVVAPQVITQAPARVFSPEIITGEVERPVAAVQVYRQVMAIYLALGGDPAPAGVSGPDSAHLNAVDRAYCGKMQDDMAQSAFRSVGDRQREVDAAATLLNDSCGDY